MSWFGNYVSRWFADWFGTSEEQTTWGRLTVTTSAGRVTSCAGSRVADAHAGRVVTASNRQAFIVAIVRRSTLAAGRGAMARQMTGARAYQPRLTVTAAKRTTNAMQLRTATAYVPRRVVTV